MRTDSALRLSWLAATVGGFLVGTALALSLTQMIAYFFQIADAPLMKIATWLVWVIGTGSVVGMGQWLVLRRYLPGMAASRWVPLLILSVAVGWGVSIFTLAMQAIALNRITTGPYTETYIPGVTQEQSDINTPLLVLIFALSLGVVVVIAGLLGGITGFVQGLVLERHVPNARWWVAATAWSWAAGSLAAFIAGAALLLSLTRPVTYDNSTWDSLMLVNGGVALFTLAALSCSPLVRLVGNSHAGWAEDIL
jgi:MFS family permease